MARNNPSATSWGNWFRPRFQATGLSGGEFAQRVTSGGGSATKQTVSTWATGANSTDANTVVIVAAILGEPATEALRAAGYGIVADAMEQRTGPPVKTAPGTVVEGIRLIQARKGLTPERRAAETERYLRRVARVTADTADILDAIAEPDDQPESA